MQYLTQTEAVRKAIAYFARAKILWLDTEVADFLTDKPSLSLIQILNNSTDIKGEQVVILDVLDRSELINEFIEKIITNSAIEKVFHHANYDLKLLGGKRKAKNVTCTLETIRKIPYYLAPVPNQKLKTLAEQLCNFSPVDIVEQSGDWRQRPLTQRQLHYAMMDAVYVAQVHQRLLHLVQMIEPEPETENLSALTLRYRQIEERWKHLDTEVDHIKKRLKRAMESQGVSDLHGFKVSSQKRTSKKVSFAQLVEVVITTGSTVDFSIELTKEIQDKLLDIINELSIEEEATIYSRLNIQELSDEDLLF